MLLKCCTQCVGKFRNLSSGHMTGKGQFSLQDQRRVMPKSVQTIVQLCSFHVSGIMLKILQARVQKYVNQQLPNVQAVFQRGTRDQIANIHQILEKGREFQKNIYSASSTTQNPLTVWIMTNFGKFLQRWEYQTILPAYYVGQEATVRTLHGTTDWFKIGKSMTRLYIVILFI